mmetsp:Transcript_7388/g.15302  ORF Transcript_7388/g.15302 Transcript_7388/m.15302 type:complete len:267 (+) Transcript_7388:306-1106(+)
MEQPWREPRRGGIFVARLLSLGVRDNPGGTPRRDGHHHRGDQKLLPRQNCPLQPQPATGPRQEEKILRPLQCCGGLDRHGPLRVLRHCLYAPQPKTPLPTVPTLRLRKLQRVHARTRRRGGAHVQPMHEGHASRPEHRAAATRDGRGKVSSSVQGAGGREEGAAAAMGPLLPVGGGGGGERQRGGDRGAGTARTRRGGEIRSVREGHHNRIRERHGVDAGASLRYFDELLSGHAEPRVEGQRRAGRRVSDPPRHVHIRGCPEVGGD